jgi:ADP-heptose:LPS heptosyltransferase
MKIHLKGMQGIGDTIYARPFIARLAADHELYIETVLPELLEDFSKYYGVKFVKPECTLRTQALNLLTSEVEFVDLPEVDEVINWHYGSTNVGGRTISGAIEHLIGKYEPMTPAVFRDVMDLPRKLPGHYLNLPIIQPIAVIRPVTSRKEFPAASRSPNPNYIGWCAKTLKAAGYYVVSVADCDGVNETLEHEHDIEADLILHKGELGILGVLSLIRRADVVVGGSGFIVPAAIAAKTPLFVIFGGRGSYDAPQRVFDVRMNLSKVGWAIPDNFCRCTKMEHDCDKTIKNLDDKFYSFMSRL